MLSINRLKDYVKKPKDGYRSIHVYYNFFAGGIRVPSEIQIKTVAMAIAQDAMHDSIYKLESMKPKVRKRLCTALFPVFEKNANADQFEKRGDFETATSLRAEACAIRDKNAQLFSENHEVVNNSWKEYAKALFKQHNLEEIMGALLLKKPSFTNEDKTELENQLDDGLNKLFAYYCGNIDSALDYPSFSGDRAIDYAIQKLSVLDPDEFIEELKHVVELELAKKQEKVEVASISDFAQIDSSVSAEKRRTMLPELLRQMSLLDRDSTQDKGRV